MAQVHLPRSLVALFPGTPRRVDAQGATLAELIAALDVQVPPQETATKSTAASNQIVLELTADGGYAINTQPVPKEQLDTQIHAIFDSRPAKLMFVKSDPDRLYQDIIEAMDVARGAGVQVIGFTPAPPGGAAPAATP